MAGPVHVTDETFPLALELQPVVVVDFWAPWCGPCRALGPVIEKLAARYDGRVTFAKLDVDENPATSRQFGVQSIPALLFFENGKLVDRTVGFLPESLLVGKLDKLLQPATPSPQVA